MWEIIDNKGVIFSGGENEMRDLFFDIKNGGVASPLTVWEGDLKLVEVVDIYR